MSTNSPFTPGVGLEPLHLAGRQKQILNYESRLDLGNAQGKNTLLVGLRGVGKSVLLRHLAQSAVSRKWLPVFRELSKRSNNEEELITGILGEIALRLKGVTISQTSKQLGLARDQEDYKEKLSLDHLLSIFKEHPGDTGDKFQAVLKFTAKICAALNLNGWVLMLDEFQLLEDTSSSYSLSLILDAISRLHSSGELGFHAVLAGLPVMIPKIVEAKPHAERLFAHMEPGALTPIEAKEAVLIPLEKSNNQGRFTEDLAEYIAEISSGYPYFIQYFAHAAFVNFNHTPVTKEDFENILPELISQLDESFYYGRLAALTNRERAIALVSSDLEAPFSPSKLLDAIQKRSGGKVSMGTVQQYLLTLQAKNILYKVRRGEYEYALPLFRSFLKRTIKHEDPTPMLKELGTTQST